MSEKHRCQKMIYGGSFHGRSCAKTAKHEHEGKWYCRTHHPPAVKARQVARDRGWHEKWARQDAERDRQKRIREAEDRLVAVALKLSFVRAMDEMAGLEPVGPPGIVGEFEAAKEALLALRGASLTPEKAE
jgi:hypothetical protein